MAKDRYYVAGYVKLAKLWEKNRVHALAYQADYYSQKYSASDEFILYDVYVDITGQKQIYKRPEMLRLLKDCVDGKINCIASQTKAYLAANGQEFCYFLKLLWDLNSEMEVITEDDNYHIDTIANAEDQKQALKKMSEDFIRLDNKAYQEWKKKIMEKVDAIGGKESEDVYGS